MSETLRTWMMVAVVLLGMVGETATGGGRTQPPPVIATMFLAGALAGNAAVDARTHRAFVASMDRNGTHGYIGTIDTTTGASLGSIAVDPFIGDVEVDETRGHVFGISAPPRGPGTVTMLDARGTIILHRTAIGDNPGAVALDAAHGRLCIVTLNNDSTSSVNVLDTRSGGLLRTVTLGTQLGTQLGMPPAPVALDEGRGRLFIATMRGVGVLDTQRGLLVRTVALGTEPLGLAVDTRTSRVFVLHGPPGSPAGRVSMLDARSGTLLRTITVARDASELAVDAGTGHVFVAGIGGVDMLDARSGAVLHTAQTGILPIDLALVARMGRVFVSGASVGPNGESTNVVDVLNATTGTLLYIRTLGQGTPRIGAVDERSGRVFVITHGSSKGDMIVGLGHLSVLDGHNGVVRQTVTVGHEPSAVVVDPWTGLSFVVDNEDGTVTILAANLGAKPMSGTMAGHGKRPVPAPSATLPRCTPCPSPALRLRWTSAPATLLSSDSRTRTMA